MFLTRTFVVHAEGNITAITRETFGNNQNLEIIKISDRITSIEDGSFSNLTSLRKIIVDNNNQYFSSLNGCLYNKDYSILMCIPQNTELVYIKTDIKGYTPHALDGLAQSRKDAVDQIIASHQTTEIDTNNIIDTSSITSNNNIDNSISDNQTYNNIETVTQNNNSTSLADKEAKFLQYVYTDEKGRTAFKYTGSGDSEIYIPEGVEVIKMFSDYLFDLNYDITYIHLPSTAMKFAYGNVFTHESEGENNNLYSVLYQCKNLQKVESASKWYTSENNGTMLYNTVGRIEQWEKGVLHKHDDQKYIDATIAGGGLSGYRLNQ
jgi:hypothetical protein